MGGIIGGSSPDMGWEIFLHYRVQNGSKAHPASYPMGIGSSFLGCKAAEA
jgi:hypothetical protein